MTFGYDRNGDIMQVGYKKKYTLVDNSHPLFNLWRCEIGNGNSYCETYEKGVNPNKNLRIKNHNMLRMLTSRKERGQNNG